MTAQQNNSHPHGDAILVRDSVTMRCGNGSCQLYDLQLFHDVQAVAGSDCNILLISIVEAQVVGLLTGDQSLLQQHRCAVYSMAGYYV